MPGERALPDLVGRVILDTAPLLAALDTAKVAIGELGLQFGVLGETATASVTALDDRLATIGPTTAAAATEARAALGELSASAGAAAGSVAAAGARARTELGGVGAAATASTGMIGKGFTLASALGIYETVKLSSSFQATMALISSTAGVPREAIAGLSQGVLELTGQVGVSPDSLAQALYHVESSFASTGITGAKALDILKSAAKGAALGHADIVDVTNALDGAIVAAIPGAENFDKAMGMLNATVGAGDMSMQDLADAFGHGTTVLAQGFGLSLKDVGAALATFGDNNIRGAVAGTQLRMMLQSLVKPAQGGDDALKAMGISAAKLTKDMQEGGLNQAMTDLKDKLDKAGITGTKVGPILTDIFGKRAGAGVEILLTQYDRLQSKYVDIEKGANNFASSWETTQDTFKQKAKEAGDAAKAWAIEVGTAILPAVGNLLGGFASLATGLISNKGHWVEIRAALAAVGAALATALIFEGLSKIATGIRAIGLALTTSNPIGLAIVALAGLAAGAVYAYNHIEGFRNVVNRVRDDLVPAFQVVSGAARAVWGAISGLFNAIRGIRLPSGKQIQSALGLSDKDMADIHRALNAVVTAMGRVREAAVRIASFIQEHWKLVGFAFLAVVAPVLAVVAAAVYAYNHFKLFRDIVNEVASVFMNDVLPVLQIVVSFLIDTLANAITVVSSTISFFIDILQGHWSAAWHDILNVMGAVWSEITNILSTGIQLLINIFSTSQQLFMGIWGTIWNYVTTKVSEVVSGLKGIVTTAFNDVVSTFDTLKTDVLEKLKDAETWLVDIGHKIIAGLVSGIRSKFDDVKGALGDLTGKLTDWKGPPEKDATILVGSGRLVIGGFIEGLESSYGAVKRSLSSLTSNLSADVSLGAIQAGVGLSAGGRGNSASSSSVTNHGATYALTVNAKQASAQEVTDTAMRGLKMMELVHG